MQRDENSFLLDMLLGARDARGYVAELTFAQFKQSSLHVRATLNAIQSIGEAASRVSAETRQLHPEVPWSKIIGMRNHIVHGYFDIKLDVVWRVIHIELPQLITQIEPLVPPPDGD